MSKYPQRCVVAACGVPPVQIEHYETNPEANDDYKGSASVPVCSGHTGFATYKWRLTGVEPVLVGVGYATTGKE